MKYWFSEVLKMGQCPQRQDSLNNQLTDLILVANKLGFYDAADYLSSIVLKFKDIDSNRERTIKMEKKSD